jgi:uncharacterized protein (TIGR00299 family) protein
MKIAYFDCFAGISGDMILGALIDAGLKVEELKGQLSKIPLPPYEFRTKKVQKRGISGTGVEIVSKKKEEKRSLEEILKIIKKSRLNGEIKEEARRIFTRLAVAEGKIHGKRKGDVHLHELGNLDAIIDIVGALSGVRLLKIKKVYSSSLHLGSGFLECLHGTLPVPAPATLELLKGIPVYGRDIEGELVTPTGAVLITSLSSHFGEMPSMKIERIGYGAGSSNFSIPNLLRVIIGKEDDPGYQEDKVFLLETNIDDMNPQIYEPLMNILFQKGALDVWLTPIQMKKNRPAVTLSLLSQEKDFEDLCGAIFNQTTTLGVRFSQLRRKKLERETRTVKTKYGNIKVKIAKLKEIIKQISPDYEECRKVAEKLDLPFRDVYEEVKKAGAAKFRTA